MTVTMIDNAGENRAFSRGTRPSGAEWRAHDGHSCPHAFASLSGLKLSLFFWHKFGANAVESGKGKVSFQDAPHEQTTRGDVPASEWDGED